ncbi:MAG: AAA family ATPase [Lachnospiraceae bacterium]|nr:AAA family ATPase [Lachnospiraceae bacterium]
MKKLKVLTPDVREGYLRNSNIKGEHYRYLHVDMSYDDETLAHDVGAGAKQFAEIKKLVNRNHSKFYLVDCNSVEDGLKAVTYMEASFIGNDFYEDYFENQSYMFDDGTYYGEDEEDDDDCGWMEYANNIPVIRYSELMNYMNRSGVGFQIGNQEFLAGNIGNVLKPYWVDCNENSICLIYEPVFFGGDDDRISNVIKFFKKNAHVYLLNAYPPEEEKPETEKTSIEEEDDIFDLPFYSDSDDFDMGISGVERCKFLIESNANQIDVTLTAEKTKKADEFYFRQLCQYHDLKREKGIRVDKIMEQVRRIDEDFPWGFLQKIFNRVHHMEPDCKTLRQVHFAEMGIISKSIKVKVAKENKKNMKELIGMKSVKEQLKQFMDTQKFKKYCVENGLPSMDYHNVLLFLGAPGTAKTTCAQTLGEMMLQENMLKGKRFASVSGAELKGAYVGQTAPKVHRLFAENDIIFIDEAYSLTASDKSGIMDSYSQEALAQLAIELEQHSSDKLIIFAGYGGKDVNSKDNKMKLFLEANPGIRSRINDTIYFPSYSGEEMAEIIKGIIGQKGLNLEAEEQITKSIIAYFDSRTDKDDFGNGREARSFVEHCFMQIASRVMQMPESKRSKKTMCTIIPQDIEKTIEKLNESSKVQDGRNVAFGLM